MRVIVADDDRAVRGLLGAMVRDLGHEAVLTADGDEAWAEYRAAGADVVLTDWVMPFVDGAELCRRLRDQPVNPYTYVIVVTAVSERERALAAVRAGIDDYLVKPVHPVDLEMRLSIAARVTALHETLLGQRQALWQLHRESTAAARTDILTGLGNWFRMMEDLEVARGRADRYGHTYWLARCELDRFGGYHDDHGHAPGDEVLARVGDTLRRAVRPGDTLFRCGSHEFLAVLPAQSESSALAAAERLREHIEALALDHPANPPFGIVTMSVGVAPLQGNSSAEVTLALAGEALSAARAAGRNSIVMV